MNPQIHDEVTRLQHYIAGIECLTPQIIHISIRSDRLQELFAPIQDKLAFIKTLLNEGVTSADPNTHGGTDE